MASARASGARGRRFKSGIPDQVMSEVGHSEKTPSQEISRREFLSKAGALLATAMLGVGCSAEEAEVQKTTSQEAYQEATSGLKQLSDQENMPNLPEIVESADQFMALPPQNQERQKLEMALVNQLSENSTPSDILVSLQTLANHEARRKALGLLWQKRQAGEMEKFGFNPLPQKKIDWAKENEIDPLTLAIAEDCFIPSLVLFQANPDKFLEAVPEKERKEIFEANKLPHRIPNPGFIAKLLMTETSGWKNIGTAPAINEINTNPDYFPTAVNDLKSITNKFSQNIPFKKHLQNIPGSARHEGASSGGAIGPQIMPDNALQFIKWYDEANHKLRKKYPSPNPFDIYTGTILAYLFVASEFKARHTKVDEYGTHPKVYNNIIRPGYDRENKQKIRESTAKWNQDKEQIEKIITAAQKYEENF